MEGLSFLHTEAEEQTPYGEPAPPPATRGPFDVAHLGELFDRFQGQIDAMRAQAAAVQVTDQESHDTALTMIGEAKLMAKKIETKRVEVKAPYLNVCKAIDGFAGPLVQAIKGIVNTLESGIRPFIIEQDRRRRQAEQEARQAAEEARRRAEAEAAEKARQAAAEAAERNEPPPPPEPVVMPAVPEVPTETRSRVETATASVDVVWDWHIESLAAVLQNRDLVEARQEALTAAVKPWINAQVKAGVRDISGVAIYQTEKVKTRVRR
jgi:hypothetical protein